MTDKKIWKKEEVYALIAAWEECPELWDVKNEVYKNRIKRDMSWRKLGEQFTCSITEVQRKTHNLRTQFHQELRRLRSKKSGSGAEDVGTSGWEHFPSLQFLRSGQSHAPTISTLDDSMVEFIIEEDSSSLNPVVNDESETAEKVPKRKRKAEDEDTILFKKALKEMEKPIDKYQIFGDYVASEIRHLKLEGNKDKLKRMIQHAIIKVSETEDSMAEEMYYN